MLEIFKLVISTIGYTIEAMGVIVILAGIIRATRRTMANLPSGDRDTFFSQFRHDFAQSTLVGMDFLVAGDIIRTVIVSHSLTDISTLAFLVAIRTLLVFTLHLELEGRWPWQQSSQAAPKGVALKEE
jgi:uncharacterized membrane protein